MKHLYSFLIFFLLFIGFNCWATVHEYRVWGNYYVFLEPENPETIYVGDTIRWIPLDDPSHAHTITSETLPSGAAAFDYDWYAPDNLSFQYKVTVAGTYTYVCTPHKSLGMTGSFEVEESPVLTVETTKDDVTETTISLYPNPASNFIQLNNASLTTSYEIFDLTGKRIQSGITDQKINISSLPGGIYFLRLIGEKPKTLRFQKQ